jgi:hypothetical protein
MRQVVDVADMRGLCAPFGPGHRLDLAAFWIWECFGISAPALGPRERAGAGAAGRSMRAPIRSCVFAPPLVGRGEAL